MTASCRRAKSVCPSNDSAAPPDRHDADHPRRPHDPSRRRLARAGRPPISRSPAIPSPASPPASRPAGAPIDELDARGHLVLPGFVNAHYHSHDVLAKGTLEEVPLEAWRLYALPPQYPPRSVEEVRARTLLGGLECLRSGMTTIQDMLTLYPFEDRHLDAVMQAYDEIGIRVVFSLQYADRKGLETIPYWKDIFPKELHPLLSTAAEPERQLDLLGHFETDVPEGAAAPARALGARPIGAGALLAAAHGAHHRARPPLRRSGLLPHLRIARHGAAGPAHPARAWRLAGQAARRGRRARSSTEPRAQRLAGARGDRSAGGDAAPASCSIRRAI